MDKMRNYGIDLFRIISMFMVVAIHVIGACGVLNTTQENGSYEIAWLLETACYGAVNCYALISGFVGINSKYKYTNIICLWLQTISITVVLQIIKYILDPSSFTIGSFIVCFIPVFTRRYWYFTDYFILFLFIPVLNAAARNLSKTVFRNILVILGVFFCASKIVPLPSLASNSFNLQDGYSVMWLMYLYLIGSYISTYIPFSNTKKRIFFGVYALCTIFVTVSKLLLERAPTIIKEYFPSCFLISYISPFILIGAIALLLCFAKMPKLPNKLTWSIKFISPLCFGVYIVHLHPLLWDYIKNNIGFVNEYSAPICTILIIAIIFGVFAISLLIEAVRFYLFKWLKVKEKILLLEEKILK